jgi:hypothetical protein
MISNVNTVAMYCSLCNKTARGVTPEPLRYNWNEQNFAYMNQLLDEVEQLAKQEGWIFIERPGPDEHLVAGQSQPAHRMNMTKYVCRPCSIKIGKALGAKIPAKSFLPKETVQSKEDTPLIKALEDEKLERKAKLKK